VSDHFRIVKVQLQHMVFCSLLFVALGAIAVGLDAGAEMVGKIEGVSAFTANAINITAHALLVLDLALFATYLGKSSIALFKEILA
jgi:hypothetical protein